MQVRLAFSIAIRARGDILLLDEVLAVGDAAFQEKCNEYFASLHGSQTVILVTHAMENVKKFCDCAILIEDGKIKDEGDPKKVADEYIKLWKQG
jgi:ABC-2 type transport system ATP-binding protein